MTRVSMFRSATLKLTVAYMAIAFVICLIFSAALYQVATRELRGQLMHEFQRWNFVVNDFSDPPPQNLPTPNRDIDTGAHNIFLRLVWVNLLVLVAAGFLSYALARRTLQPIEAAHEQQKRFTSDVSHELRTPLTAIKMETEVALLDKSAKPTALRKVLGSNLEEANKLEALINNLLRLAKLESSQARETFQAVPLEKVVTDAVEAQQKHAAERKQNITASHTPAKVLGDQAALAQLVTILIDNALKYSANGSAIEVNAQPTNNNQAIVTVVDHGNGIEPTALPHIFDRFYRADSSRGSDGYGLGLSLAKMITDLHEGSIELTSALGKGTTATVRLPLADSTVKAPRGHQPPASRSGPK